MGTYRLCKRFTVESGHMLSKHPEGCRYPHGHSRTIEVVLSSKTLNSQDMVVDFKALKLAVCDYIDRFDHRTMIHRDDPLLSSLQSIHPDSVIVCDEDPTTEVMARMIFEHVQAVLVTGFSGTTNSGITYTIDPGRVNLERVRVWETATSWAEYAAED
ncbi:MAG: 6-carboxytetrahydropterin synthase [Chthonomonas sp.]|nr:6-carboxytetrahydropterin synthase [Chthonomonas sp.]